MSERNRVLDPCWKIAVINGPNLNMLGKRNPEKYGKITLPEIIKMLEKMAVMTSVEIFDFQSNHEGELIDRIQACAVDPGLMVDGIIINAGGYAHTSVALHDAIEVAKGLGVPCIEVHLSDVHKREIFRHPSFLTDVCIATYSGLKEQSYVEALKYLVVYLDSQERDI